MNTIQFNQPGGFPLSTNILDSMQNAYSLLNSIGWLAGNYTIISGCKQIGNTISEGVVFIDGELYPFKSGQITSKVRIVTLEHKKQFEDGNTKTVLLQKYAEFGTGSKAINWDNFKRFQPLTLLTSKLEKLEEQLKKTVPIGLVAVWDRPADEIPAGWVEHTELSGKAPVGQDTSDQTFRGLGRTIGAAKHQLTTEELPEFRLKYKDIYYSEVHGQVNVPGGKGSGDTDADNRGWEIDRYTESIGNNKAHNIIQPSRIVRFIRFVGI